MFSKVSPLARLLFAMLTMVALGSVARAAVLAGPVTNPANGHAYYLLGESTWTNSETQAIALGGHLATVNDAAENQWVLDTLVSGHAVSELWIGLTDSAVEGTWEWVDGDLSVYRNFRSGEPNGDVRGWEGCDYGSMYADGAYAGQWNDTSDTNTSISSPSLVYANGVVEVPEPATMGLLLGGGLSFLLRRRRRV